ncbi:hypothetical protein DY000_02014986 [Brassica cretica]|uniref:Uncharacterized protein n=1 Tax=Brassica cretica TaxID=69181 RepID=A0ABQ7D0M3_BRACR|nr:hypothetical protein DY000_02014986 [Brassica cretica]
MDFSFGYFSKARILKLSKDLGYVETQLVRSERPATLADSPVHVLIISPMDSASSDASGQEPNENISKIRWPCEPYQATVRDSSFGGLVSHIKHQLKSGISEAFCNLRATLQSIQFSIRSSYPNKIQSSEPILGSFKWYQSHSSGIF